MALLERPHVRDRLRAALRERRLVLVQAPAGYGKSTAIGTALAGETRAVVRYDAAPWDADAFVEPLVAAVRTARPEFGRRALALAEANADPRRIGSVFASDLGNVAAETLIVIEDVHVLGAAFGAFVDGLLRVPPPGVTLLLTSRTAPQFALADLLLRDLAAVFSSDDLRFDREAIAALAQQLAPGLTAERLDELTRRTEGWPAGIVLSLRTDTTPIAVAGGSFEAASAFLVEQLLRTFDAAELATLERLAVYDAIDDRVIDTDAEPGTRDVLNRLEARGTMIARLPSGAFRVHPMLRDVIVQRIGQASGAGAIAALHARAAAFYADTDRIAAALFHLDASGNPQAIHDVLLRHGTEAIERGHGAQVARLAATLGASAIDAPALVAYLSGWAAKQRGDDRARERFAEAAQAAAAAGDGRLAFAAQVEVIEHDLARGRPVSAESVDALRAASAPLGMPARAAAEIRAGWHAALGGRFADALASADDAIGTNIPVLQQAAVPLRAYALTVLGRFADAEREITGMIERLQDADSLGLRTRMLVWSARLSLLRGDTRAAYDDALEARRTGSALIVPAEAAAMHVALAEAATHAGDAETAAEAVARVLETAGAAWYELDRARFPALAALYRARSIFLRDGARAALRSIEAYVAGDVPAVQRAMLLADAACYAADDDRANAAAAAISAAIPLDAADAAGLNAAAAQLAHRAAASTNLGAYAALAANLDELERRGPRFESRLAVRAGTPAPPAETASQEHLTPREAEILELLALGLTNKEIAQRLVLGTRTVETHVARILGKLGVNSRSRAIAAHIRRSTDALEGAGLL